MFTYRWLLVGLLLGGTAACGDSEDGGTTPEQEMEPDAGEPSAGEPEPGPGEPEGEPSPNPEMEPDEEAEIAQCEAACEQIAMCPQIEQFCPSSVLDIFEPGCKNVCPNANARPAIISSAQLDCATVVPIALESAGVDALCNFEPPAFEGYNFESRFTPGANSVSYSGQVARQVLIEDLKSYLGSLSGQIDGGTFMPTDDGQVVAALDFYFRFDSDSNGEEELFLTTDPPTLQSNYNSISTGKDLVGKLAGNDTATDHKDWSTAFGGWSDTTIAQYGGSITSPEGLVRAFFETVEENAINRADGVVRNDAAGNQLPVYVTESGLDLNQLIQKFLTGAIALSQGTDDYLDDDVEGKGLLASNAQDEDKPYSSLEHAWDEGFGYFGAARDYDQYTDEEVSDGALKDTNGDGSIDLNTEFNFGVSVNAAKRDKGSSAEATTDYTTSIFTAFREGRAIIAGAGDTLTEDELTMLRAQRDIIVVDWERALAATAVHYINDTLRDMNAFGSDAYDFSHHAKVWSELKGFALTFQFNPRSPLSDEDFVLLHSLIGDAPVLASAEVTEQDDYRANLLSARDLLRDSYGFDSANMGDANGENGW